jgi:predicted acyltransferase
MTEMMKNNNDKTTAISSPSPLERAGVRLPAFPTRLLALDVFRGITIAGMILVNNPGAWDKIYAPLGHAQWNGLTPTDLVFPFFMFIMGISTYISLRKYDFEFSSAAARKIVKRTVVIFAIGLGLAWFSLACRTWNASTDAGLSFGARLWESVRNFDHIRIMGVLPRLAVCYGVTALTALSMKHKNIPWLIITLLTGYFLVLLFGRGFEYNETNILSVADRAVLGVNHMYKDNGIEPEGLLSTIPAVAHVLIGFCCGKWLMEVKDINDKLIRLFLTGAVLTFLGFLLSYGCPINKKVWSPTFTLATCGLASSFLALLVWIIDVKGHKSWSRFFEVFGANPLFIYVMAGVVSIILGGIRIPYGDGIISLHGYAYSAVLHPLLGDYPGSLAYAVLFVACCWAVGYVLYKKKLYIKI